MTNTRMGGLAESDDSTSIQPARVEVTHPGSSQKFRDVRDKSQPLLSERIRPGWAGFDPVQGSRRLRNVGQVLTAEPSRVTSAASARPAQAPPAGRPTAICRNSRYTA